jgi:hypothetical protein
MMTHGKVDDIGKIACFYISVQGACCNNLSLSVWFIHKGSNGDRSLFGFCEKHKNEMTSDYFNKIAVVERVPDDMALVYTIMAA